MVMDPSEQEIFTGSGTYIMNERVECSGYVTSVYFCGVLVDEREPWPQPNVYRFTLLHLRLSGDMYNVIDQEIVDYENMANEEKNTFNPTCHSSEISGWYVLQGDQFGVILYANCEQRYCPIQIGLINNECIDTSLFVTDSSENSYYYNSRGSGSISKNSTSLVTIKLNFEIHYDDIGKLANTVLSIILLSYKCGC